MNIVVINGTETKGCTWRMKEMFLQTMGNDDHKIKEYELPRDCPHFCLGCKACFYRDITVCPHAAQSVPIWRDILQADLLVFTSPVYVFHATGQMKALLDHFATKWMAHSPEIPMFSKQAVIITNAAGAGMGNVIKDIGDSLFNWGCARIYPIKQALFNTDWNMISEKNKRRIKQQCEKTCGKIKKRAGHVTPSLKSKIYFNIMRIAQKMIHKSLMKANQQETIDHYHWRENGWLKGGRPWKA